MPVTLIALISRPSVICVGVPIAPLALSLTRLPIISISSETLAASGPGHVIILFFGLIRKHFVGLVDFFELGVAALVDVWVVLLCELVEGLFDVGLRRRLSEAENFVVIFLGVELSDSKMRFPRVREAVEETVWILESGFTESESSKS